MLHTSPKPSSGPEYLRLSRDSGRGWIYTPPPQLSSGGPCCGHDRSSTRLPNIAVRATVNGVWLLKSESHRRLRATRRPVAFRKPLLPVERKQLLERRLFRILANELRACSREQTIQR